jgi:Kinesin motor domain
LMMAAAAAATTQQLLQQPNPSVVSEKIAHFESETKKNVVAAAAAAVSVFPSSTFLSDSSTAVHKNSSSKSHNHPPGEHPPRFQVILRVRPSTDPDASTTIQIVGETKVRTHPPPSSYSGVPKEYTFDRVLGPDASQQIAYEQTAAPLVSRVLKGGSVLLFCYGVTNAGKTYTVHGTGSSSNSNSTSAIVAPEPSWGIMPRVLHDMYTRVQQSTLTPKELQVSFFEIYQERFYDLLPDSAPGAPPIPHEPLLRKALRLREHRDGQVAVRGLAVHTVCSMEQALQWMKVAKKNRVTGTNKVNVTSSRSHFVCQLSVVETAAAASPGVASGEDDDADKAQKSSSGHAGGGSFWVVDLAGSERSKRTGASGRGMSQKEASTINTSNMVLMHCLMSLQEATTASAAASSSNNHNSSHGQPYKVPPYRNSQLTRLLMPHWSVNSSNGANSNSTVTAMIVNVNPAASDYDESQHVLGYANQATTIQLPPSNSSSSNNSDSTGAAAASAAATRKPVVEYDENGRRVQAGAAAAGQVKAAAKGDGMRAKVGKVLRKLSPMRGRAGHGAGVGAGGLKRKQAEHDAAAAATTTATTTTRVAASKTSSTHTAVAASANKRFKSDSNAARTTSTTHAAPFASARSSAKKPPAISSVPPTTVNVKSSVAYKKVKAELAVAKTENEILLDKNRELEALVRAQQIKMVDMDCEIRSSVMNDLGDEMESQRKAYEAIISDMRQQIPSASVMKRPLASPYLDVNARKIQELEDEVQEYEEQVDELRAGLEECRAQLSGSEAERARLRKENQTKEKALKEYRLLLAEEEPDEDELVQDDEADGDGLSEDDDEEEERRDTVLAARRSSLQTWDGFSENHAVNDEEMDEDDEEMEEGDDEPRRPTLLATRPESPCKEAATEESPASLAHAAPNADAATRTSEECVASEEATDEQQGKSLHGKSVQRLVHSDWHKIETI